MSLAGDSQDINNPRGVINMADDALQMGIYDFFPGLVYVYDLDQKQLRYINKKLTDSLGYSYDDLKEWKQDFGRLVFKDDLELVQKELEKYYELKEHDSHGYQCRLNRKEGDYIHFQVTGKVIRRNDKGKPESVLFIAQDISEQIKVADEARAFRELMDDTETLLQFSTWRWDAITNIERWSKGVYPLLNYNEKEIESKMSSKFFLDHIIPKDRERIDKLYNHAIDTKQEFLSYEYTILTHDQQSKILHSTIRFRYANEVLIGALGINRDVTEKSTLINSLLGYREMIMERDMFLDQGTFELDIKTGDVMWSDGMYTLYGYDPVADKEKMTITEALYKKHLFDDDFESYKSKRGEAFQQSNSAVWQYQIATGSGEIKQLETYGKMIRDAQGEPIRLIGTTRDVTKIVKYERELERKIVELRRSNKDLEDFAYIASHDMHEPLRKVHSFADRLRTKHSSGLDEEAKGYLERILSATQNARLMIDGLMEFSRLSRNGDWFEKIKLNEIVAEVLNDLELKIEETNTKIEVTDLPEIEGMKLQLKQLFANIILNAIKFRKQDVSPVISIKCRKLSRQEATGLNLDINTEYYKLMIKDNGIGFEEEYAETIFQMFQRLNSKNEYPGSGIGLALCKKITDNHQGVISASSSPGEGTIISIILPEKHN
ncbi:MAG: PAS domain-containing protein [Cyclobacteriaceae bacterium]|nr:PAS domain-containing protein [Cyclobacteriaceae bacterium]